MDKERIRWPMMPLPKPKALSYVAERWYYAQDVEVSPNPMGIFTIEGPKPPKITFQPQPFDGDALWKKREQSDG